MQLPRFIKNIIKKINDAGFEAYTVGGAVKNYLSGEDLSRLDNWDLTTSATPEELLKIFPKGRYENKFGTVIVPYKKKGAKKPMDIEITTYRTEATYSDKRHPDKVGFTKNLKEDLKRRDFTINAIVWDGKKLVDLFSGQEDFRNRIIKAVGNPDERFREDALRMLRAIRFATTYQFIIENATYKSIKKNAKLLQRISKERIRDEFMKIIASDAPAQGMLYLHDTGLLEYIIPELKEGIGITQNWHHIYTIFQHCILSLAYCPSSDSLVRLATFLHDISKPETKVDLGKRSTFHGHQTVGAKKVNKIMEDLKFSNKEIYKVTHLIKHHMFYYNIGEITDRGVRRLLSRVGKENMADLIDLRVADRIGSGCPKAKPYKLIDLERRIVEAQRQPLSVKMLKVDGYDVMNILKIKPGPKVGKVLNQLLEEVLDDPKRNRKRYLKKRIKEMGKTLD